MDVNPNYIVAIVLGVIAAAPGVMALLRQMQIDKRKQPQDEISSGIRASKDAAEIIRQYSDEIQNVRKELQNLRDEVEGLRKQLVGRDLIIEEWRVGIDRLIAQLISLGHTPVWKPKPVEKH